jgi:hypothetical protein
VSRKSWDTNMDVDLKVDSAQPLSTIETALDEQVAALTEGAGGLPSL